MPMNRSPSISPPPPASRPYLNAIDRTCRPGVAKYDLSSFYASPGAMEGFVNDCIKHFDHVLPNIDAIVGLDALGFPMAGAVGYAARKPVILARKAGKLALTADEVLNSERIGIAQLGAEPKPLEIRKDLLRPGMKVLVVDEWIDSGQQMMTVIALLRVAGVEVAGIGTLQLREGRNKTADQLLEQYNVFAGNIEPKTI